MNNESHMNIPQDIWGIARTEQCPIVAQAIQKCFLVVQYQYPRIHT